MGIIILLLLAAVVFFLFRFFQSRQEDTGNWPGGAGSWLGGALSGMVLGYLLHEALISSEQFNQWKNLGNEELQQLLEEKGILDAEQFQLLTNQMSADAVSNQTWNGEEELSYNETSNDDWSDS